ncbi:hypothetical protein [Grimontia sp. NTOU-MAR1]|nr:hypothetical protein [Grimontia sp. NTOU-MAR1]WRV97875.1 hypothetical protein VP504_17935 [Grimontia sp. NTOU-MAR1]
MSNSHSISVEFNEEVGALRASLQVVWVYLQMGYRPTFFLSFIDD